MNSKFMFPTSDGVCYYTLILKDDTLNTFEHVVSSLMLITLDYELALNLTNFTHIFGSEIIQVSIDRNEIMVMQQVLTEENLRVIVEKHG